MHTESAIKYGSIVTTLAGSGAVAAGPPQRRRWEHPSLYLEQAWRQPWHDGGANVDAADIVASRWTDERTTGRLEKTLCPPNRYVVGVALRPVKLRLSRRGAPVFEGVMPTGMVHVTEPGQPTEAEFFTPCDFIHFHVTARCLRDHQAAASERSLTLQSGMASDARGLGDLLVRDDLAAQLSRTLTHGHDGADPLYADSVGRTILLRVLALRATPPRVGALPKWRLRRVHDHLAANIADRITLADLANAAGISRMHFAAQFRAATGCRPHDYLLQHRIECAKQMLVQTDTPLVEVALNVGFQTQSHFSTVFKRLAGDTPARWQRTHRLSHQAPGLVA